MLQVYVLHHILNNSLRNKAIPVVEVDEYGDVLKLKQGSFRCHPLPRVPPTLPADKQWLLAWAVAAFEGSTTHYNESAFEDK